MGDPACYRELPSANTPQNAKRGVAPFFPPPLCSSPVYTSTGYPLYTFRSAHCAAWSTTINSSRKRRTRVASLSSAIAKPFSPFASACSSERGDFTTRIFASRVLSDRLRNCPHVAQYSGVTLVNGFRRAFANELMELLGYAEIITLPERTKQTFVIAHPVILRLKILLILYQPPITLARCIGISEEISRRRLHRVVLPQIDSRGSECHSHLARGWGKQTYYPLGGTKASWQLLLGEL